MRSKSVLLSQLLFYLRQLLSVEDLVGRLSLADDIVDAHDAVRPGGPGVVDDGAVALGPDPAAAFGKEPIVLGAGLAFVENCD